MLVSSVRSDAARCWRAIQVALVRPFDAGGRRRLGVLLAGLVAIGIWQWRYMAHPERIDASYRTTASHGIEREDRFVYFLYYLGLYPVASLAEWPPRDYSEAGARRLLERAPERLVMDIGWTFYPGEMGKGLLYLFDAWLKGSPRDPSLRPFHRLVWTVTLLALFTSFWWLRRPLVGAFLVLFMGSNPFQLYAIDAEENVRGWTVMAAGLVLALSLPFLGRAPPGRRRAWILPLITGIVLGSIRTVRTEPVLIIVSALAAYVTARALSWRQRLALVAVLLGSFVLSFRAWQAWFDAKDRQARAVLAAIGGHPFPGTHLAAHQLWHPIWCGLGDFDTTHGYRWLDEAALAYAQPILERDFGIVAFAPRDKRAPYLDAERHYLAFPYALPHYEEIIRAKVLHDIAGDPLWYLGILGRRAWRLLDEPSPVRVDVAFHHLPIPMHGLVLVPLAALLWRARARLPLKLLLFTLPTCFTPFAIYSGEGMSYYAIYPIAAAAILATAIVDLARRWISCRWRS